MTSRTTGPRSAVPARPQEGLATELVIARIRRLVMRSSLRSGQRLPPERELARQLGVSRASVRAGLAALAAKGVLVTRHGAGTFVADGPPVLDSEPLTYLAALHGFTRAEMFEARRVLEVGVAGLAADRATSDQIATIAEEVADMFAALDDPQTFLVHDIRFHRAVATASGNPILASVVEMVSAIFYEQRRRTADRDADRRDPAEMHRRIYRAIKARDRAKAELLMSEHLHRAEREQDEEQASRRPTPVSRNGAARTRGPLRLAR